MEIVRRHIVKHIDGYPVNFRLEPVKSIREAFRVNEETFHIRMTGHFKPDNPEDYYMQEIEISYREVAEDEREHDGV